MKRIIICVLFSLVGIGGIYSQYDPQFSQYMLHTALYNPAAVGEGDMIQMSGLHRIQWADTTQGFGGTTTFFAVSAPLKINGSLHGVGFRFLDDKFGLLTNRSAYLQYAYRRSMWGGVASVGADIGFISVGFLGSKVKNPNIGDYYDFDSDDVIPKTDVSGNNFDLGAGFLFTKPEYYFGLSFSHITSPTVSLNDKADFKVRGTTYLTGGYMYELPETKFSIKPSGLFKTDYSSFQLDLSGRVEYDSRYWGGLSYRFQDAVIFMAGVNIAGGLSIGYSFDLPTSRISTGSWGSHEFMLSYSFAYLPQRKNTKIKSIRIM